MFSQFSVNYKEEQPMTKCFKITIQTGRSILFQTEMEFQRDITRP